MNDKNKYLIIVVALALAIMGALFYNIKSREATQPKLPSGQTGTLVEQVDILIAKKDIATGQSVTQDDFIWHKWPKDLIDSQYVTHDQTDIINKLNGGVVRESLVAQEPLRSSDIYLKGDKNAIAVILESGKVAVALPLKSVDNANTLYRPGDMIDVILPKHVDNTLSKGEIVLDTVKIIAVDDRFSIPPNEKIEKIAQVLVLQLTREQASKLSTALVDGHLIISQHSASDNTPGNQSAPEAPAPVTDEPQKIVILRGSQSSTTSVNPSSITPLQTPGN